MASDRAARRSSWPGRWFITNWSSVASCAPFVTRPLGLRDGLLAQMAADYDRSTRSGRQIESERWDSIRHAVQHYRVDMNHALQVRNSAMELFSALKSLHHLPPEYPRVALGCGHAV